MNLDILLAMVTVGKTTRRIMILPATWEIEALGPMKELTFASMQPRRERPNGTQNITSLSILPKVITMVLSSVAMLSKIKLLH